METPAAIRRLAGIAALVSAALAVLVLVTWQFDAWRVATFGPDYVPMARITALVLLGLGSAMARRFLRPADPGGGRLAVGTAALGAAVAALELARWVVPFGLPWDAWIRGGQTTLGRFPLDRMSPLTAVGLLLTAGAILLSETAVAKQAWSRIVAALAAGIALLLAVIAVLGYASGRPIGYVRDDAPMALLTAIAVATLNAAWLLVHWQPPAVPAVAPDSDRIRRREQVFSRSLIGGTSAALLLLAIIGVAYLRLQDNEARDETYLHLDAITREKIEQISQWREERLDDARFLQRTPAVGVDIASFLANPADPRARGAVTDWLGNLRNRRIPYAAALLFDAGGNLRLAVPQNARAVGAGAARELAQALAGGDVIMGDIRRAAPTEPVYLDLLVPFPGNVAGTGAVVVLRVDPTAQLFPLLVNAPLSDAPGQFVLLRQEGDELVRLNDLPDQPGSALTWRRRIDQPDSVGLALARGEWGHREDLDENGTPMFVSFRRVPNSTWLFAARVAKAEAFAAHRGEMWTTSVLVGVLLGATVLGAGVISRQRRAVILQQALRSEHERETLARRLALITRHANDAILFFDESLRIVEANERALATYGYTAEEIRHRHITDLLDPSTAERAAADFATAMRSDGHIFETHHRRRDGSTFPVEVSARAIELDGRRHILSLVRDITERRQAEIEIRRVSELHSAMLKLPEAAEKLDEKAFLQQALKLAEDLTGSLISFIHLVNEDQQTLELVTWSRRTLEHYCHASHDQHYPVQQAGIWAEALRQRRTVVFNDYAAYEHKHGLPEGLSTLQRLISLPIIENDRVVVLLGVGNKSADYSPGDVETVRLIGEYLWPLVQRGRNSQRLRKLSRIIEQAPLSVVITDTAGAIEYVNPKFSEVTGYAAAEVLGQNPRILKSDLTPGEVYREMWAALSRGDVWSGEIHNLKKNGDDYIENAVVAPVVDQEGKTTNYVALKEDVTNQRRTLDLLEKERQVSEMKTRFISVTSHEFRTPMATAMGSVELLANHLDRLAPAKREELLHRIITSLQRMNEMLDEVLLLNRMDAKRTEVTPQVLDLGLLVRNTTEEIRLADRAAHPFDLTVQGDPAGFVTDPSLIHHILTNLLSNAVRYSPAGTRVTVRLAVDPTGARIEVEDQGIGIPPADLPRLFQPFERGSNAGTIKGTGLGLSIVKRMIELLGGTVAIELPAGGGTRFVVRHPRLPAPAPHS